MVCLSLLPHPQSGSALLHVTRCCSCRLRLCSLRLRAWLRRVAAASARPGAGSSTAFESLTNGVVRCLQRLVEPLWKRHRRGFALLRGVSRGGARLPRRLAPWHARGSSGGAGRGPALLRITGVGAALADAIPLRGGRHGAAPGPQAGSRDVEGHLRRAKRPRARTVGVARGHALATCSACGPP